MSNYLLENAKNIYFRAYTFTISLLFRWPKYDGFLKYDAIMGTIPSVDCRMVESNIWAKVAQLVKALVPLYGGHEFDSGQCQLEVEFCIWGQSKLFVGSLG